MARWLTARLLAALGLATLLCISEVAWAQATGELVALDREIEQLLASGKVEEALPIAQRAVERAEKTLGSDHTAVAGLLLKLAEASCRQGRMAECERHERRALGIREKALGPNHPDTAEAVLALGGTYEQTKRPMEAEQFYTRALAIYEGSLGSDDLKTGAVLGYLARFYHQQGRLAEAEQFFLRILAIREKALGPEHSDVGQSLNVLGQLYQDQGRYADAEPLLRRSLAIYEKTLGPEHPHVGTALNNLASVYRAQDRYAEAELLFKRSLIILEKALGPDHPDVGMRLHNLGELYQAQDRYADAEPLVKRSLAIVEKALGPDHPDVGLPLANLAQLYRDQGRYSEAEPLLKRNLTIREKGLGPEHRRVGTALNNLAQLYRKEGRYADAEPLYKRSLAIAEKTLGPEHPVVGTMLNNLASLASAQSDWAGAADYWRRGTAVIKRRAERGLAGATEGSSKGEAQRLGWRFAGLVRVTFRLAGEGRSPEALTAEMFETAQWAQGSEAAASLAQMAARSAKGSPQLSPLVRERQDLVSEWQAKDKLLISAKANEPARRSADAEKALADRLAAIDMRLAEINRRLAKDFPDYAALASPAPASVVDVQAQLAADEALVLFLDTHEWRPLPEETFVWVVTRTDVRWVRSELGTVALTREVAALRCGLDADAWDGAGAKRCADALGLGAPGKTPDPLPFDHARAHKLYLALFGEVQDLIKGKHLLIVPSGPLTQLPFQVLVTAKGVRPCGSDPLPPPLSSGFSSPPDIDGCAMGSDPQGLTPSAPQGLTPHRAVAWLARSHAITILPAVSSLKALRRVGTPSAARKPLIGFGNPLLDGPDQRYAGWAKLALAKQSCQPAPLQQVAALNRGTVARVVTRSGLADVADIKRQTPLPETADELCAVAENLKVDPRDIRLGGQATEREVKRLSAGGELAGYRIVHFATHGALAGELDGSSEPGLILTPPETASAEDDGYLSASDIAALKLDADWVILSACNTAAGGAGSAEALSGLGRAFIYAGARALLVSHWAVDSDATVNLITGAVGEMARDAKVGRAEALRRSMLRLIDKGSPQEAHPAYWAPFIVVGEGAAMR